MKTQTPLPHIQTSRINAGRRFPNFKAPIHDNIVPGDALYTLRHYLRSLGPEIIIICTFHKREYCNVYLKYKKLQQSQVEFFVPSFGQFVNNRYAEHPYYYLCLGMLRECREKSTSNWRGHFLTMLKQLKDVEDENSGVPKTANINKQVQFRVPGSINPVSTKELYL